MSKIPLRALPRTFVLGADPSDIIELPSEELDKLRKVLRLSPGAEIAVLPGDGTVIRCKLAAKHAEPLEVETPDVEPTKHVTVCQALPKGDKLDEIVRACTEIGVSRFVLFTSDRSVMRWDEKKTADRLRRISVIAREAAEVSYRTRLPEFIIAKDLADVLKRYPNAKVLSEVEGASGILNVNTQEIELVIGPEGGWSPKELGIIGDRGISLGPRVLRVDHAGPAAAAILLLHHSSQP